MFDLLRMSFSGLAYYTSELSTGLHWRKIETLNSSFSNHPPPADRKWLWRTIYRPHLTQSSMGSKLGTLWSQWHYLSIKYRQAMTLTSYTPLSVSLSPLLNAKLALSALNYKHNWINMQVCLITIYRQKMAQLQTSLNTTQFSLDNLTHQLNDIHKNVNYILEAYTYTCGGTGGWRSVVVYLNMTDPTNTCPPGWNTPREPMEELVYSGISTADWTTLPCQWRRI